VNVQPAHGALAVRVPQVDGLPTTSSIKRHPEYFRWFDLPFWNFCLFLVGPGFGRLIAVSEATAVDLRRYYRLPAGKLSVIEHGMDPAFRRLRRRHQQAVCSCGFHLAPAKNLDGLLRAFAEFRRGQPRLFAWWFCVLRWLLHRALNTSALSLGLADAVEFPGWSGAPTCTTVARAWRIVLPIAVSRVSECPCWLMGGRRVPTPPDSAIESPERHVQDAALRFVSPWTPRAMIEALLRIATDETLRSRLAEAGPAPRRGFFLGGRGRGDAPGAAGLRLIPPSHPPTTNMPHPWNCYHSTIDDRR